MVTRKLLGRKTGKGFYTYPAPDAKGAAKKAAADAPRVVSDEAREVLARFRKAATSPLTAADMQERMLLRFVKECIHCAEEGVLAPGNPQAAYASGDVGAIFGIGFPPFLGGPFRYCDLMGTRAVADAMQRLADTVGPQFAPPRLLLDLARDGKTFHAPKA
jgi:enoyl-CoA hydratase/long-chain 3-hydroxyacyl-CoA dehydrogenase